METLKFCFAPHHAGPELLAHTRKTLEELGATCTVEVELVAHHRFELHVLTAVMPKKLHPVKFTRALGGL